MQSETVWNVVYMWVWYVEGCVGCVCVQGCVWQCVPWCLGGYPVCVYECGGGATVCRIDSTLVLRLRAGLWASEPRVPAVPSGPRGRIQRPALPAVLTLMGHTHWSA